MGWEVIEGNSVLSRNTLTIGTTNTIIKAKWELNVFNLSIDPNGGTLSKNYNGEYVVGTNITLEVPIKEGYTFTGWTSTSGSVSGNTFTIGNSDAVLTANWKAKTVEVTLDANGGAFSSQIYTSTTEHVYTAQTKGEYKLEVWGAQGGSINNLYYGGYGGYSTGIVYLEEGDTLYTNVGGQGEDSCDYQYCLGGYNGGGGATHIALSSGLLNTFESKQNDILIVAGGGGGTSYQTGPYSGIGGSGGGGGYGTSAVKDGTTNTGGGGRGCFGSNAAGLGGSGIVVIRNKR